MKHPLDELLRRQRGFTVVNLWDEYHDACRFMDEVMDELEACCGRPVTVVRLPIEDNRSWALEHHVEGTPALLVFEDGRLRLVVRGRMDLAALLLRLRELGL